MKSIRIILTLTFVSLLLSGCDGKETMDFFTNNWWIAIYVIGFIGFSSICIRYQNSEPAFLCAVTLVCIIISILYRCGLMN